MARRPSLTIEYHYKDHDVGAHPTTPAEAKLWAGFSPNPAHRPTHIVIRPDTLDGQRLSNHLHDAADIRKALQEMITTYGALHDRLSDLIEDGRFTKKHFPDDYQWLVNQLAGPANRAINKAQALLDRANAGLPASTPRRRT